ncbi:MAG: IctB family putative bicarbonate transporter [Alkalinema sp. CAN_BIN05]|nr:IctB family putative bicarbonate transporter [Alkalinema sp. CAN_BIN05]
MNSSSSSQLNLLWQQITLQTLPLYQWRTASYVSQVVGALQCWRSGSVLLQWGDGIALGLLGILFAAAPYISTTLISLLLVGCIGFWALLTLAETREKSGWGLTPIHLTVMVYWGISAIATGLSPVRMAALEGLSKLTLYLLIFVVMARVLRLEKWRSALITIYLHTALLVSCYGIRQWIFGAPALATWSDPDSEMGNFTRAYSFLGNPNLLSSYLMPAVAYSLMAIFSWVGMYRKALAVVMFATNLACVAFTYSRGGWIGLVLMFGTIALLLGYWMNLYRKKWVLPSILGGLISVIVIGVVFVPPIRNRVLSMFIGRGDSSNNFRLNVWQSVIEMIKARPVLGIGPGNDAFNKVYPLYARTKFTALSAYSLFLEISVETGLVGLTCFLWMLLVTFTQGGLQLQRLRNATNSQGFWLIGAIGAMVGLLGQGVVDTVWYRPQVNILWWMAVAIVASFYNVSLTDVRKPMEVGESSD